MSKILLISIASVILLSCEPETNTPVENKIYFTGISKTDSNGSTLSIDTTDWKTNDIWSMKELNLFKSLHQSGCALPYDYKIIAYPNPGNGVIALFIDKPADARVELRLVDENFNTLISNDSITQNNIHLNASTFGIQDTVRLYYKFVEYNCEWKGHGDILIQ